MGDQPECQQPPEGVHDAGAKANTSKRHKLYRCSLRTSTEVEESELLSRKGIARVHAEELNSMCPQGLSVKEAYAVLRQVVTHLEKLGIDVERKCSSGAPCHLLNKLPEINNCLLAVNMELRETVHGLSLGPLPRFYALPGSTAATKRAALIVRWLIYEHRCVTSLDLDDSITLTSDLFTEMWLECVHTASGLTRLHARVGTAASSSTIWHKTNIFRLYWLQDLHLEHFDLAGEGEVKFEEFADFLEQAKLTRLSLSQYTTQLEDPTFLLSTIGNIASLTQLTLDVSCLHCDDVFLLADCIWGMAELTSLTLRGCLQKPTLKVSFLVDAVEGLEKLEELRLEKFFLDISDIKSVAKAVVASDTLLKLNLETCQWLTVDVPIPDDQQDTVNAHWAVAPLLMMVTKSKSLQILGMNLSTLGVEQIKLFLAAALKDGGNPRLSISSVGNAFYQATLQSELKRYTKNIHANEENLKLALDLKVPCIYFTASRESQFGIARKCLADLALLQGLRSLHLRLKHDVPLDDAYLIIQCLQRRTVTTFTMNFVTEKLARKAILKALATNKNIQHLCMKRWDLSNRDAAYLARIVCSSRSLISFTFDVAHAATFRALLVHLAEGIEANYHLTYVRIGRSCELSRYWLAVRNVVARNKALVERAALFVFEGAWRDGTCSLRNTSGAMALSLVHSSNALAVAVQRDNKSLNECREQVQAAFYAMCQLDAFMRLSGVVRTSVVCNLTPDKQLKLDAIPMDCWLLIIRYLKFGDITVHRASPTPTNTAGEVHRVKTA